MEPEGSLPLLRQPATCPYPEPDQSSPYPHPTSWISPTPSSLPDNAHNTHNRQTSMPPLEFEPAIPARERPQNHALDSEAYEIGLSSKYTIKTELLFRPLRRTP